MQQNTLHSAGRLTLSLLGLMILSFSSVQGQKARKLPAQSYISTVKIEVVAARSEQGKEKATRLNYAEAMVDSCLMYYAPYPNAYFWKSDIYSTRLEDAANLEEKSKFLEQFLLYNDSLKLACANPNVKIAAKKECDVLSAVSDSNRSRYWRECFTAGVEQSKLVDTLIMNIKSATDSAYLLELTTGRDANADSAVANFKMAIQIDPQNGDAYIGLGNVPTALGRLTEAADFLKKALANSDSAKREPLIYNLAYMYAQNDEYCQAMPYFREYWQLNPDDYSAAANLAVCYNNCKLPDSALAIYQLLVTQYPDSTDPLSEIGIHFQNRARSLQSTITGARDAKNEKEVTRLTAERDGFRDSARVYLKRYFELRPTDPIAAYEYGRMSFATNKNDEALAALEKSISLDPKMADALILLGDLYQGKGKFNDAIVVYEKALDIQPDNKPLMATLSQLYTDLGKTDKLAALQKRMK